MGVCSWWENVALLQSQGSITSRHLSAWHKSTERLTKCRISHRILLKRRFKPKRNAKRDQNFTLRIPISLSFTCSATILFLVEFHRKDNYHCRVVE